MFARILFETSKKNHSETFVNYIARRTNKIVCLFNDNVTFTNVDNRTVYEVNTISVQKYPTTFNVWNRTEQKVANHIRHFYTNYSSTQIGDIVKVVWNITTNYNNLKFLHNHG